MSLKVLSIIGLAVYSAIQERNKPKVVSATRTPTIRHPGSYLSDKLYDRGWSPKRLAREMGIGFNTSLVFAILHNRHRINTNIAQALGDTVGPSTDWWLARQYEYDRRNR